MIHTLHPDELFEVMNAFEEPQRGEVTKEQPRAYIRLDSMDDDQQDKVAEIVDLHIDITEQIAVQAVNDIGFDESDGNL